jgi:Domain of unknown function (DUF4166)
MTPLYRRLLGPLFDELPAQVQRLHDVEAPVTWSGRADVQRGSTMPARALARLFGLPPHGADQPITVMFVPQGYAEVWTRIFGADRFVSTQRASGDELRETVGPLTLRMTLQGNRSGLGLTLVGARFLGIIPVPGLLLPRIRTHENEIDGRYHFDVEARLPVFGLLVHYRGWLERVAT